jgi:hypothetical protein
LFLTGILLYSGFCQLDAEIRHQIRVLDGGILLVDLGCPGAHGPRRHPEQGLFCHAQILKRIPVFIVLFADTSGLHKGKPITRGHRLILQLEYSNCLFGAPLERMPASTLPARFREILRDNPLLAKAWSV